VKRQQLQNWDAILQEKSNKKQPDGKCTLEDTYIALEKSYQIARCVEKDFFIPYTYTVGGK